MVARQLNKGSLLMNIVTKAGLVSAAIVLAAMPVAAPVSAADLGGSTKDTYSAPAAPMMMGGVGPCYVRGDVGYSVSGDPDVKWPVNNLTRTFASQADHDDYYNNGNTAVLVSETTTFAGAAVSNVEVENTWLAEGGIGCGSGSRGFRAEMMFGYRGDRKLDGVPQDFTITDVIINTPEPPEDFVDPLHTSLQTYTLMFNVYKDLGQWNRVVPYVGAGVGVAYHDMDEVFFTGNPNLTNRIEGNKDIAFAWSLMAGIGYQISDRAILDLGYRYINMGDIRSGRVDTGGFVNPPVEIEDIDAHEFKVGMRYHFGSDCCEAAPLK
jgi:opacity protein-like surface antigen